MSIGCSIYFTPMDRAWIGTLEFIRGVARLFGVERLESLSVWRMADVPPDADTDWDALEDRLLDIRGPAIEVAIAVQRAEAGCTTIMELPVTETLTIPMGEAALASMDRDVSEGWVSIYASIHNGRWVVYDQGGDWVDGGACCIELGNDLGYPVQTQKYLEAFLRVPAVMQFQRSLEALSAQPWMALMELT